jgi:outer membrane immunogenic protein
MKKLALTAVSLLIAGSASAADLRRPVPVKAAPAPIAVGYNWTGCYIGAGGGYGMFDQETQYNVTGVGAVGVTADNGGRGWFGTVQVGCDYQVGSNIVIGAFADYDFSDISGNMSTAGFTGFAGDEKLKSTWSAGGRIGYLPFQSQQLLVFVSGGYTQARFDAVAFSTTGGVPTTLGLAKNTYDGWFIGSGYEYQFGWLPIQGLTWKTEYRFADYGSELVQLTTAGAPLTGNYLDNRKYVQTIRSSLVWRFNFGGPVVARY